MKKNFKLILLALSIGIITTTMTGCYKKVPIQKTRTVSVASMDLNKEESSATTQDGITIKVKAIHPDNIDQYAALRSKASYWYYKRDYNGRKVDYDRNGYYDTITKKLDFSLTGYPAFEVKITNSTNHVLKLSSSDIAVEDNSGNQYDALSKEDLKPYLTESVSAHLGDTNKYTLSNGQYNNLNSKMRKLRLVDNNLKVYPGKTVKAYAIFNYGFYTVKDSKAYIMDNSKLTLSLYGLPSQLDKAGTVTKRTNFNFVYDIKVKDTIENYTVYVYR